MQNLVNKSKYQVFVYGSRAHIPFVFASHSWFVINKKGSLSRWEVIFKLNKDKSLGHLHIDALPPFNGISALPFLNKYFWESKMIGYIEGEVGSTAEQLINTIEKSKDVYPYLGSYLLPGPNSNTYVQWVLNHFPEIDFMLDKSFIGKDYLQKNGNNPKY